MRIEKIYILKLLRIFTDIPSSIMYADNILIVFVITVAKSVVLLDSKIPISTLLG